MTSPITTWPQEFSDTLDVSSGKPRSTSLTVNSVAAGHGPREDVSTPPTEPVERRA